MLKKICDIVLRFKWVFIALWVAVLIVVMLFAPSLSKIASSDQESFLPKDSDPIKAAELVNKLFPENAGKCSVTLVLERKEGLNDTDRKYAKSLEDYFNNHEDFYKITDIKSPFTRHEFENYMISKDKKAAIIAVNLNVKMYTDESNSIIVAIRDSFKADDKVHKFKDVPRLPDGLTANVTGDIAIVQEQNQSVNYSMKVTAIITVVLLIIILLFIYRSPVAPLIPLVSIGVSFLISRGIIGWMAQMGLKVSSFTETFLIAVLFGAGTDYCLFIISRFREEISSGKSKDDALRASLPSTGEAIVSSSGTVIIAFLLMAFAKFGLYKTTGPSVAIGVSITLLAVMTLTPSILAIFGEKIFWPLHPSKVHPDKKKSKYWAKLSMMVTQKPMRYIIVCLVVFIPFAISLKGLNRSFDQLNDLPESADCVKGFNVMSEHFGEGEILPLKVVIKSDKNMWDNKSLQMIERISYNLCKVDNVAKVRSATRPDGTKFDALTISGQLHEISKGMEGSNDKIDESSQKLDKLRELKKMSDDMDKKTSDFGKLSDATGETISGISHISDGIESLGDGSNSAASGLGKISGGLKNLSSGVGSSVEGILNVKNALLNAKTQLKKAWEEQPDIAGNMSYQTAYATVDGVITNIDQITSGLKKVNKGINESSAGLSASKEGLSKVGEGITRSSIALNEVVSALEQIKDAQKTAGDEIQSALKKLNDASSGLDMSKDDLLKMTASLDELKKFADEYYEANKDDDNTFFLPSNAEEKNEQVKDLKKAMESYISPDSKGTVIEVVLSIPPYELKALDTTDVVRRVVNDTLKDTYIDGVEMHVGGISSIFNEVRNITSEDFFRIVIFVLLGIFVILCLLLRSLIAPIYLLMTIVISYATTMGLSYIVFQVILGYEGVSWSTTYFAFCLLVALGVDYNIFLISRVKEEYRPGDVQGGVARALTSTGGIITSCGIIMAGTFGALLASPIKPLFEIGFAAVVGLLMDTFIIRSMFVPAIAVKVGEMNWWPGRKVKVVAVVDNDKESE